MKKQNIYQDALIYAMTSGKSGYNICEKGTSFCKIKLITLYVKKKMRKLLWEKA